MAKAEVHSTTRDEENKVKGKQVDNSKMVRLVSSMQHGVTFLRIDSAPGGRVEIPGLNDHLKGEAGGVLVDRGSSVCVLLPREQWDEIKAKYSDAACLQPGAGGLLPAVHEIKSDADYAAQQSELKEFRTGAEPSTAEEVEALKRKDA